MMKLGFILGVVGVASLTGCIERKITILSNPEGALVELNHREIGRTPVTVHFDWYGDYDIVLRYEKEELDAEGKPVRKVYYLHTHQKAEPPPHQWLGIDFVTEVSPFKFEDHKTWAFVVPEVVASNADIVERARDAKEMSDRQPDIKR